MVYFLVWKKTWITKFFLLSLPKIVNKVIFTKSEDKCVFSKIKPLTCSYSHDDSFAVRVPVPMAIKMKIRQEHNIFVPSFVQDKREDSGLVLVDLSLTCIFIFMFLSWRWHAFIYFFLCFLGISLYEYNNQREIFWGRLYDGY